MKKYYILTNNPMAAEQFSGSHDVDYEEISSMKLLEKARERILSGEVLLNHPLYGSVKPNETPYRSLLLKHKNAPGCDDYQSSLKLIDNSIYTFSKFTAKKESPNPKLLEDYQVVDISLLKSALDAADR